MAATSDGWRLETAMGTHHASAVLLALPTHTTARLLTSIDPEAARLCAQVPHASTVSITLAWHRDEIAHPLRGSGFVVARDKGRITASTWISSKWSDRSPQGYTLVRAFIGGVRDPYAIDLPDEQLIRIATSDLGRILGIRAHPQFARVYRWRDASPQLSVGHEDRVREIERRLAGHRGLFASGRGLRTVGIPDCVSDARVVAASAAEYLTRSYRESRSENYQHG